MMKDKVRNSLIAFQEYLIRQGGMSNLEFHDPAKPTEIKRLEKHLDYRPPQEVTNFYLKGYGYSHTWLLLSQEGLEGRTVFFDLKTTLGIATAPEEYQLQPLKYLFDKGYLILEGNVIDKFFTLLEASETGCNLFLFLNQQELIPLNVSLDNYVRFSLAAGGLFHWQMYISESTAFILERLTYEGFYEHLEQLKDILPSENFVNSFARNQEVVPAMDYAERVQEAFSSRYKGVKMIKKEVRPKESMEVIRRAELSLKHRLPDDYLRFFRQLGGMEMHWQDESGRVSANFKLLSVGETFGGPLFSSTIFWENSVAAHLDLNEEAAENLKGYYPLVIEEPGITMLREEQGAITLFYMMELEPLKMVLSFSQYIDKLLLSRGLAYWQLLFLENPYSEENPLVQSVTENIQTHFPEVSLVEFRRLG